MRTVDPDHAPSSVLPSASASPPSAAVLPTTIFAADHSLAGQVLLLAETRLYPTAAAALAASKSAQPSTKVLPFKTYTVVASMPGVAKVRTETAADDCMFDGSVGVTDGPAYAVEAFVAREFLIARLNQTIVVEHPDFTGGRAERGAPLLMFADGHAELLDRLLNQALGPIPRERVGLATLGASVNETAWPSWKHEIKALVCDPKPEPLEAWQAKEAERRKTEAERRKESDDKASKVAYQQCLEAEQKAPPAKAVPKGSILGSTPVITCDDLLAGGAFAGSLPTVENMDLGFGSLPPPNCDISEPNGQNDLTSRVGGQPFATVSTLTSTECFSVFSGANGTYIAELGVSCGTVRVEVPAVAVNRGARGKSSPGRPLPRSLYSRNGSAVTWLDVTAAGTVARSGAIIESTLFQGSGGRLCTKVEPFAEPLCQAKRDLCETLDCKPKRRSAP